MENLNLTELKNYGYDLFIRLQQIENESIQIKQEIGRVNLRILELTTKAQNENKTN